jgi:hypothetical protein
MSRKAIEKKKDQLGDEKSNASMLFRAKKK